MRPTRRTTGRRVRTRVTAAGADAAGGPQPAEPDGADPQPLLGDGGQQGHRAAEQHGEQVEGDGAEQHRVVADELQALEGVARCPGRAASSSGVSTASRSSAGRSLMNG